jgi:hypothetical protein
MEAAKLNTPAAPKFTAAQPDDPPPRLHAPALRGSGREGKRGKRQLAAVAPTTLSTGIK